MTSHRPFTRADLGLLIFLMLPLFWALASYPAAWDPVVAFALFPQVNHVLDGMPLRETWLWQDLFQHNAGASPVYSALAETGLHAFGLELIAARLPVAGVLAASLTASHWALRRWVAPLEGRIGLVLGGTSCWFLVFARSGGIVGLGFALFLLATAALLWAVDLARRGPLPAGLAGFSGALLALTVVLLPYGHTATRLPALVLALAALALPRLLVPRQRIAFAVVLLIGLLPQLENPALATRNFFESRGEALTRAMQERTDGTPGAMARFAATKVAQNAASLGRFYFGLNDAGSGFWSSEVTSSWNDETVLFPRLLVPFLVLGVFRIGVAFVRQPWSWAGAFVVGALVTVAPGLLSGVGNPNPSRLLFHLPFVYGAITLGLVWLCGLVPGRRGGALLLASLLAVVVPWELYVYFGYERVPTFEASTGLELWQAVEQRAEASPDAVVVAHPFPDFRMESFVMLRWRGGGKLERWLAEGRVILLSTGNIEEVRRRVQEGRQIVLFSEALDNLADKFPEEAWLEVGRGDKVVTLIPSSRFR